MRGRFAATQSEVIFRRPTTMFSDHDNQTNAAAAAPAPEAETAPNATHPETNSTVESAAEQTAPSAATEQAEAASTGQETQAAVTPGQTGASADSATAQAAAEANLETHASFFFSSRRRHTRSLRDWSSDVCSSDLQIMSRQNRIHQLRNNRLVIAD